MARKKEVEEQVGELSQNVMAAEAEVRAPSAITLKVTAVIEVTPDYLKNVNSNALYLRDKIAEAAEGLMGSVVSVEIA